MVIRIYTLSSSRNPEEIKYVGKTKQTVVRRLQGHLTNAKKALEKGNCTNHNYNWINYELNLGNEIIVEEVDSMEFSENENWNWFEQYWIAQFKSWGFKLTNIRKGGEDNHYSQPTEEVIRARAEHFIGKPRDEKTKSKISEKLSGIKRSEETIEKIRNAIVEKQGRSVLQFDREGNFIKEWPAAALAARELGADKANIISCCKGKRKSCKNFIWKYKSEETKEQRIIQLDLKMNFIKEFKNSAEAERELGINAVLINRVCKHVQPKTYDYIFMYYDEYYNKN